jgi:hypothetical protein
MNSFQSDRVRVNRVQIQRGQVMHEIADCWVSISAGEPVVGIWISLDDKIPVLRVPLEEAVIEWPELDVPM